MDQKGFSDGFLLLNRYQMGIRNAKQNIFRIVYPIAIIHEMERFVPVCSKLRNVVKLTVLKVFISVVCLRQVMTHSHWF